MTDRTAEEGEAAGESSDERAEEPTEERSEKPTEERAEERTAGRGEERVPGSTEGAGDDSPETATTDAETPPAQGREGETESGTDATPSDESTATALAARVREYDDDLAERVQAELEAGERAAAELRSDLEERDRRIEDLESRVEELEGSLRRKQADFQNFKKRQQKKVADQQSRATENLLQRLLPVRDNLVRALEQDENADIRGGVEGTLSEFDRVLDAEDVTPIDPDPGTATDPERHEVMMRVESDQPEGTVVDVFRPGYETDDRVVRTAQVTVSEGGTEE